MTRPTRLEAGHNHLLAYCTECPSWRRLAADRAEGHRLVAAHLFYVHELGRAARSARYSAGQADTPDTPTGPPIRGNP